jgi:hypothetical protein
VDVRECARERRSILDMSRRVAGPWSPNAATTSIISYRTPPFSRLVQPATRQTCCLPTSTRGQVHTLVLYRYDIEALLMKMVAFTEGCCWFRRACVYKPALLGRSAQPAAVVRGCGLLGLPCVSRCCLLLIGPFRLYAC